MSDRHDPYAPDPLEPGQPVPEPEESPEEWDEEVNEDDAKPVPPT